MIPQKRTINGTSYEFHCMQARDGLQEIEVYVKGLGALMYPKFRYLRKNSPWALFGQGTAESSRLLGILSEIWDGANS